eukprot:4339187-Pleurochrysis_carterae.AAC.2
MLGETHATHSSNTAGAVRGRGRCCARLCQLASKACPRSGRACKKQTRYARYSPAPQPLHSAISHMTEYL